jgi:G3E family GTPase
VGYLSKILSNIQCIEHSNLRLLEPITIVDARRVSDEEALQEPLCLDQISHAHTVVVSKCETWDDAARQHAEEALRQINPHAQILAHPYQELSPTWFDSLLEHYYGGEPVEEHEAPEEAWESLTLNNVLPCELSCVLALLQDAVRGRYGYVVRAKGFLRIDSLWAYCDISEGRYSVQFTDPPTPATSNMVFIGKALKRGRIRSNFTQRPSV